jgi:hypothetical protein
MPRYQDSKEIFPRIEAGRKLRRSCLGFNTHAVGQTFGCGLWEIYRKVAVIQDLEERIKQLVVLLE